jgi:hypothetical protein
MQITTQRLDLTLLRRELLDVRLSGRLRVECLQGRLWITLQDGLDDIVLEAGESADVSHCGMAAMQALRTARVVLSSDGKDLAS